MEETIKQPEIISRLELLKERVFQLETSLYPISWGIPKEVGSNTKEVGSNTKNESQVMALINNIIERVSDIKDSIDIS